MLIFLLEEEDLLLPEEEDLLLPEEEDLLLPQEEDLLLPEEEVIQNFWETCSKCFRAPMGQQHATTRKLTTTCDPLLLHV